MTIKIEQQVTTTKAKAASATTQSSVTTIKLGNSCNK
jgi:hypothetical protein